MKRFQYIGGVFLERLNDYVVPGFGVYVPEEEIEKARKEGYDSGRKDGTSIGLAMRNQTEIAKARVEGENTGRRAFLKDAQDGRILFTQADMDKERKKGEGDAYESFWPKVNAARSDEREQILKELEKYRNTHRDQGWSGWAFDECISYIKNIHSRGEQKPGSCDNYFKHIAGRCDCQKKSRPLDRWPYQPGWSGEDVDRLNALVDAVNEMRK